MLRERQLLARDLPSRAAEGEGGEGTGCVFESFPLLLSLAPRWPAFVIAAYMLPAEE